MDEKGPQSRPFAYLSLPLQNPSRFGSIMVIAGT